VRTTGVGSEVLSLSHPGFYVVGSTPSASPTGLSRCVLMEKINTNVVTELLIIESVRPMNFSPCITLCNLCK
jgi:hypothetical protein